MSGTVYYAPVNGKGAGTLVTSNKPTQTSYTPAYKITNATVFPQTGNDQGIFAKLLGFVIAGLTLVGIDFKKQRNH